MHQSVMDRKMDRQHLVIQEFPVSRCAKSLKIPVLTLLELFTNTARQPAVLILNWAVQYSLPEHPAETFLEYL